MSVQITFHWPFSGTSSGAALLAAALLLSGVLATGAMAWPQVASQNVGLGAQSAFLDHGNANCSDGRGGSFVAWTDVRGPNHVYVQHLDASGAVAAGWPASGVDVTPTDGTLYSNCTVVGIHPCGVGSAAVIWIDWDDQWNDPWHPSYAPFRIQRVSDPVGLSSPLQWGPAGIPLTAPLCSWDSREMAASAAPADDGGVLVALTAGGGDVRVQHVTLSGTLPWGPDGMPAFHSSYWPCNDFRESANKNLEVERDGLGGAFVAWDDDNYYNSSTYISPGASVRWNVFMEHLDANGLEVPGLWNSRNSIGGSYTGIAVSADTHYLVPATWTKVRDGQVRMVPDGTGGAILAWQEPQGALCAQHVLTDGTTTWGDNSVSPPIPLHLSGIARDELPGNSGVDPNLGPRPVSDGAGGAIITFARDDSSVVVTHLTSAGVSDWNGGAPILLTPHRIGCVDDHPSIVADGLGGANIAWEFGNLDGTHDIATQHVDNHGNLLQGSSGAMLTLDAYEQLGPKVCLDGGIGAIVTWIDQRPGLAPFSALLPAGARATSVVGGMFAQQVNSVGQLGGPVISTYTAGVGPASRPAALMVHGGAPNPALDRMRIAFSLPSDGAARLEVMDVAGRRVWAQDVGAMGAGRHVADLGATRGATPGLYFVRLRQGGNVATGRVVLAR